jgi:hypothetical protein
MDVPAFVFLESLNNGSARIHEVRRRHRQRRSQMMVSESGSPLMLIG